jgi:hypothetical protein
VFYNREALCIVGGLFLKIILVSHWRRQITLPYGYAAEFKKLEASSRPHIVPTGFWNASGMAFLYHSLWEKCLSQS